MQAKSIFTKIMVQILDKITDSLITPTDRVKLQKKC